MNDFEKAAASIDKVRAQTIVTNRFYGVLVTNVEPVLSRKVSKAATDGKKHYFNPEFVNKLTPKQLRFVQRHESEHDARHHSTRRGNREPVEYNIAADFAINIDLVDEIARGADMEVPPEEVLGGKIFVDPKYRGMSVEDIYRSRELDRQRAEQEKQKQQSQESQPADEDDKDDTSPQSGDDEDKQENDDETEKEGSSPSSDDDDTGDATGSDEAGKSSGEKADGDEAEGKADGAGDEAGEDDDGSQDGSGAGEESGGDADSESSEGDGEGETGGQAEPKSVGDIPGGIGEVIDASDNPTEVSDEEAKWERVVRQAAAMAKNRGDLPGHIIREIDRANQPQQDWREVLRSYFDQGASRIETWNRPNRRFIGSGLILPGSQREGLNSVVFLVDTSGSVDEVALKAVSAEAQAALDEGIIDNLTIVYGDTRVTRTDEYVAGDQIEFDPRGGGGTRMQPLFQWVAENVDNPSLIVAFTDGYIEAVEHLGPQPSSPVLWSYHGYPDVVRQFIANTPWGEAAIDVGSH